MLATKSQKIALERARGDKLVDIARRHRVTHQRVSAIVQDAREFVNRVELDLMVARKTGEVCLFVIPFGPDYSVAMAFGDWLIDRLRARDLQLRVSVRRVSTGLAYEIEDVTDYSGGSR